MGTDLNEFSQYNTRKWDEYYHEHDGIKYPHEQLVIYVNYLKGLVKRKNKKALEIGFGTIADMQFLYRMGFEVYGLEVSKKAVEKGIKEAKSKNIALNLIHWTPPKIPFEDNFFDFFCSSNSIHFNLDQNAILSEIKRILKQDGYLYTTYLAPGHKFIGKSKKIGENLIQFTEDHCVPKMRKMVMVYYDEASSLKKLYSNYFSDVRVTRLEYNILDAPNAYWIVTAHNK